MNPEPLLWMFAYFSIAMVVARTVWLFELYPKSWGHPTPASLLFWSCLWLPLLPLIVIALTFVLMHRLTFAGLREDKEVE